MNETIKKLIEACQILVQHNDDNAPEDIIKADAKDVIEAAIELENEGGV